MRKGAFPAEGTAHAKAGGTLGVYGLGNQSQGTEGRGAVGKAADITGPEYWAPECPKKLPSGLQAVVSVGQKGTAWDPVVIC